MKKIYNVFVIFLIIFFKDRVNLFMIFFFNAFLMIIFGFSLQDKYTINLDLGIVDSMHDYRSKQIIDNLSTQPNIIIHSYDDNDRLRNDVKVGKLIAGIEISKGKQLNVKLMADSSRRMWLYFLKPTIAVASKTKTSDEKDVISSQFIKSSNLLFFDFIFPGLLIFSIMQIGLSGGILLLTQRMDENLKRLQITPLKKWEFLIGYISCYLFIMIIQVLFYIALATSIFDYSISGSLLELSLIIIFSSIFFINVGIILCNFSNKIETGNNFNRFFVFPASFICGVYLPISTMPTVIQKISLIHPLTYFVEISRGVINYGDSISSYQSEAILLLVTLLVITFIALRTFKWQKTTA
jgi:ABC-2 type transport system permease protein